MASNRLEAIAVREYQDRDGNTQKAYTNLGNAWAFKDKEGFTLKLDAVPAPQDGQYTILLVVPKQKDNQQGRPRQQSSQGRNANFSQDLDDDIPFAPEFR